MQSVTCDVTSRPIWLTQSGPKGKIGDGEEDWAKSDGLSLLLQCTIKCTRIMVLNDVKWSQSPLPRLFSLCVFSTLNCAAN